MNPSSAAKDGAESPALRDWSMLGLSLLLAWGMWSYVQGVMLPSERAHFEAIGQPVDIGDLYPRWHGARELLLHGRDPYSPEVSGEIQTAYYGRPLDTVGADRGRDEQRFVYPVYVVFFLAPTLELSFTNAQIVIRWALAILTAWSVLLWLRALPWQPPVAVKVTLIVLTLSSPALVQGLRLQQLALLVAFLLAACAAQMVRGRLLSAGCLLACATIKPQLAFFPVLWFLIWVIGNWKQRQRFVWGFAGTLALLMAAGELVLPGWLWKFIDGLEAYRRYVVLSSSLDFFLGRRLGTVVAVVVLSGVVVACWRWRRVGADDPRFLANLALVLALTVTALPLLPPFNQVLLLPGVLIVLYKWNELWASGVVIRSACRLASGIALAIWISAGVIAVAYATGFEVKAVWLPFLLSFGAPPAVAILLIAAPQNTTATLSS